MSENNVPKPSSESSPRRRRWLIVVLALVLVAAFAVAVPWGVSTYRKSRIERCVIAYVGDDQRVHLTDPEARIDLRIDAPTANAKVEGSPLAWSPDGKLLAWSHRESSSEALIIVLDPVEGTVWKHPCEMNGQFAGWCGDEAVLETSFGPRDARTGRRLGVLTRAKPGFWISHVCPVPGSDQLVAVEPNGLHLKQKDFEEVRPIDNWHAWSPQVDASGTWLGWTTIRQGRILQTDKPRRRIAIKMLAGKLEDPAIHLVQQFQEAVFCDWTPDGNILANVVETTGGQWRLIILDRDGKAVRDISTKLPPAPGTAATWKKTANAEQ